ncbi:MAG: hypothetical protein ACXVZW_09600 [Gaiellaceae bacterium]
MTRCRRCGEGIERSYRFCPWCAAPQRLKLTAFFPASRRNRRDQGKALRVSRYLNGELHVRLSIWTGAGEVEGAVSIDEREARQLADFLTRGEPEEGPRPARVALAEARDRALARLAGRPRS